MSNVILISNPTRHRLQPAASTGSILYLPFYLLTITLPDIKANFFRNLLNSTLWLLGGSVRLLWSASKKQDSPLLRSVLSPFIVFPLSHHTYFDPFQDAVQDQSYISGLKTSEFQNGPRVVKMVLNTLCYLYLFS